MNRCSLQDHFSIPRECSQSEYAAIPQLQYHPDPFRYLIRNMRDIDDGCLTAMQQGLDDFQKHVSVGKVQALAWFIEQEKVRRFHKSPRKQRHALQAS